MSPQNCGTRKYEKPHKQRADEGHKIINTIIKAGKGPMERWLAGIMGARTKSVENGWKNRKKGTKSTKKALSFF